MLACAAALVFAGCGAEDEKPAPNDQSSEKRPRGEGGELLYEGQTGTKVQVGFAFSKGRGRVSGFKAKGLLPCRVPAAEVDRKGNFEATCLQERGRGRGVWIVTGSLLKGKHPRGKIARKVKLTTPNGSKAIKNQFGWNAKPAKGP